MIGHEACNAKRYKKSYIFTWIIHLKRFNMKKEFVNKILNLKLMLG